MSGEPERKELKNTGCELFILMLSLLSIVNMLFARDLGLTHMDQNTFDVVAIIDVLLTVFFLFDFCYRLFTTDSKSRYFLRRGGWADLLAFSRGSASFAFSVS